MRASQSLISLVLAGTLLAFWPADGKAGTVGKVNGVVTDAAGQPLPGANVVIEDTRRGATTDNDGYYLILSVDPGRYELTASMVGYATAVKQNALVQADFTTRVDFTLEEAALEAVEMVVVAERPPVEPDRTSTRYVINLADIQAVPLARETEDLIELQPGVSLDGDLRIRGSNVAHPDGQNEVFVQIDGVRLVNSDGGTQAGQQRGLFFGVNKQALQEVSVLTGGMDAEYGNAQGGVFSLVTREARATFGGLGEYRLTPPGKKHWGSNVYDSARLKETAGLTNPWSDSDFLNETDPLTGQKVHERTDYTSVWGNYLEGSLSGPLAEDLGFFVSGRYSRDATAFPSPLNREPFNMQMFGNATYRAGGNIKVKLGGIYAAEDIFNRGGTVFRANALLASIPEGVMRGVEHNSLNLFLPEDYSGAGTQDMSQSVVYGTVMHSLSPKTFYELRVSYQQRDIKNEGVPAATEAIRRDSFGFHLARDYHGTRASELKRWFLKADLSSQVTKGHLVKAGAEFTRYSVLESGEIFVDAKRRHVYMVGKGDVVIGMEPFHPIQYGAYIQDKMEFEGLVINAGVRFDAISSRESIGQNMGIAMNFRHYDTLSKFRNVPIVGNQPTTTAWSPRLGLSHPITERSTLRFFTGRFTQLPDVQGFYHRNFEGTGADQDLNGNGQIDQMERYNRLLTTKNGFVGWAHGQAEATTSVEAGFDWNFAGDYIASLSAFYKDQEGGLRRRSVFFVTDPVDGRNKRQARVFSNMVFNTSRGFEVAFKKMFNDYTSFNLAYNAQWLRYQQGGRPNFFNIITSRWYPDSSYVASDKYFNGVTVREDGQEIPKPLTEEQKREIGHKANEFLRNQSKVPGYSPGTPIVPGRMEEGFYSFFYEGSVNAPMNALPRLRNGIDRRNYGTVQFLFSTPADFHIRPLSGFRATMVWRMQTGTPFLYTSPTGVTRERSAPLSTVTDVNFEKDFQFGGSGVATAFLEVRNLWNQKDDMTVGFNPVQYGLQEPEPGDSRYEQFGDVEELVRYGAGLGRSPRLTVLGARFKF